MKPRPPDLKGPEEATLAPMSACGRQVSQANGAAVRNEDVDFFFAEFFCSRGNFIVIDVPGLLLRLLDGLPSGPFRKIQRIGPGARMTLP